MTNHQFKFYSLEDALQQPSLVRYLSLHARGMNSLPKEILLFTHLEELELSGNAFEDIPELLMQVPSLRRLNLSHNHIQKTNFNLTQLPDLEQLNLSHNQLKRLPKHINKLEKLQELQLDNNKINALPERLDALQSLKKLSLKDNRLKEISTSFNALTKLQLLDLSNNPIKICHANFKNCQQLQHLNISVEANASFIASIAELPSLEQFSIGIADANAFPKVQTGHWKNLRRLKLQGNGTFLIPDLVFDALNIRHLSLVHFSNTTIPSSIAQLQHLESLKIIKTPIQQLPESFKKLQNLRLLRLPHAQFETWPEAFLFLNGLRKLETPKVQLVDRTLRFIAQSQRKSIPDHLRLTAFEIGNGDETKLEQLSLNDLLHLLHFSFRQLIPIIHQYILHGLNVSEQKKQLKKGAKVAILGRTYMKIKDIQAKAERFGITVANALTVDTTHVILGKMPQHIEELSAGNFVFIEENQLTQWLQEQEQPYLMSLPDSEVLKISELLLSKDASSINVALELLKNGGVPPVLLTDMLIGFKQLEKGSEKRLLRKFLALHLPTSAAGLVPLNTSNQLRPRKAIIADIERLCQGTPLNTQKLIKYLVKR